MPVEKCGRCLKPKAADKKKKTKRHCNCGAPTKYSASLCDEIIKFFSGDQYEIIYDKKGKPVLNRWGDVVRVPRRFPTIEGFANELGVVVKTLHNWEEEHPEFLQAVTRAKQHQKDLLIANTLQGLYDNRFGVFVATNCTDMIDEKKVDVGENLADILKKQMTK